MAENLSGQMLTDAIATGAGGRRRLNGPQHSFQASGETSAGSGAATIQIQVSNADDPSETAVTADAHGLWITAGTITLTLGTTVTSDGFAINAPWKWARAWISAISGTDGTVNVRSCSWTGQ
jgi:hypothetical protein